MKRTFSSDIYACDLKIKSHIHTHTQHLCKNAKINVNRIFEERRMCANARAYDVLPKRSPIWDMLITILVIGKITQRFLFLWGFYKFFKITSPGNN